jgi:hypothetical protein
LSIVWSLFPHKQGPKVQSLVSHNLKQGPKVQSLVSHNLNHAFPLFFHHTITFTFGCKHNIFLSFWIKKKKKMEVSIFEWVYRSVDHQKKISRCSDTLRYRPTPSAGPLSIHKNYVSQMASSHIHNVSHKKKVISTRIGLSFLAHLSWKLKWAFLIALCPSSVCPSVCLSVRLLHF